MSHGYDLRQSGSRWQWKSPSSPQTKKARMSRSSTKIMLIVFSDIRGIVHCEFVPQGQTVNTKFYYEVLQCWRENIR
jgi:hypothetical protein